MSSLAATSLAVPALLDAPARWERSEFRWFAGDFRRIEAALKDCELPR